MKRRFTGDYQFPGDDRLPELGKELQKALRDAQKSFGYDSLRLRKAELADLASVLVEFAQDIHHHLGIWTAYERCNLEFFGVRFPAGATLRPQ